MAFGMLFDICSEFDDVFGYIWGKLFKNGPSEKFEGIWSV